MKKKTLFCTEPWYFLSEVPLIWLLWVLIRFNDEATGLLKYYPLAIVTVAGILVIFLYFFRFIVLSYDEVRMFGLFSSRDRAILNKGKTVILTQKSKRKISLSVFGTDGQAAALEWLRDEEPRPITMFRETFLGNFADMKNLLSFFTVPKEDLNLFFEGEGTSRDYKLVFVESLIENEKRVVKITLKETFDACDCE